MKTLEITLPNKERILLVEQIENTTLLRDENGQLYGETEWLGTYSKESGIDFEPKAEWVEVKKDELTGYDIYQNYLDPNDCCAFTDESFITLLQSKIQQKGHSEIKKWAVILIKE